MTGIYGIDPIMDYTFAQEKPKYCLDLKFNENSVMDILEKYHPKYAYMVKKAKLAQQFSDLQFRGTIFAPKEESLDEKTIMNMDINTCRTIVKYHFMVGFFPKDVLNSSFYQQLHPALQTQQIRAALYRQENGQQFLVLNNEVPIIHYGEKLRNGYIHIIDKMLSYPFLQLNLN